MKLENFRQLTSCDPRQAYDQKEEKLSDDVFVKMTFRHGARPMTEKSHDIRQHVSKEGSNRSGGDTSNNGKHAFPDI